MHALVYRNGGENHLPKYPGVIREVRFCLRRRQVKDDVEKTCANQKMAFTPFLRRHYKFTKTNRRNHWYQRNVSEVITLLKDDNNGS